MVVLILTIIYILCTAIGMLIIIGFNFLLNYIKDDN